MAVKFLTATGRWEGLSTDTKPTNSTHSGKVRAGDTFYETNTGLLYISLDDDGSSWVEKLSPISAPSATVSPNPMFGTPTLIAINNSRATWEKGKFDTPTWQKGTNGWVANLYGGLQTGYDDFAAVYVPVNELPVGSLTAAMWTWYQEASYDIGMNMVIWVHDPTDNDKRAELTQLNWTGVDKTAGWNSHELDLSRGQWTLAGEGTVGHGLTGTDDNTWEEVVASVIIGKWTIYRISFEWGYYTNDVVLSSAYVADIKINGIVIPLKPSVEEQLDIVRDDQARALTTIPTWTFGAPVLRTGGEGRAGWQRAEGNLEGLLQKGPSGIIANLYGGLQTAGTGDVNWAAVYVPVNELPIPDFNSAQWTYRFVVAQAYGHNMVIWAHDPSEPGKRIEITQAPSGVTLAKATGYNSHVLDTGTTQFWWFGEDWTGDTVTTIDDSGLASGTQFTWAQFQADKLFSTYKIYRISIEDGWYGADTFGETWLTELMLNGQSILLQPGPGEVMGRETKSFTKATVTDSTDDVALVTPGSGRRIKVIWIHMVTASATGADFECYFSESDAMPAAKAIAIKNLDTDFTSEYTVNFGDNGPVGQIDERVSMRTSVDVSGDGTYIIVYREI